MEIIDLADGGSFLTILTTFKSIKVISNAIKKSKMVAMNSRGQVYDIMTKLTNWQKVHYGLINKTISLHIASTIS